MFRLEICCLPGPMRLTVACGLMFWLAGCTMLAPAPTTLPDESVVSTPVVPPPAPERPVEDSAPVAPAPIPVAPLPVAILYEGGATVQSAIAARISEGLADPAFSVRTIDIDEPDTEDAFDAAAGARRLVLAAVGPRALEVARQRFADSEIVFCHVLEPGPEGERTRHEYGVAPMPPPALQFAAWAEVDPGLGRIGLITGEAFAPVVREAQQAARTIGAELASRISTSDRETLYNFRRLAPEIDGLWLVPDGKILSTAIILQILAHAAEYDISVLVFSESLLAHGGLITVGAPPDHVARTVIETIETIGAGKAETLPSAIPLREGAVRVNAQAAETLALPRPTRTEWVVRDPS